MEIKIISIGKKHDENIANAINDYEKRLKSSNRIDWVILKPLNDIEKESQSIIKLLNKDEFVILLDETGKNISSIELSKLITQQNISKKMVFVIGGAYGVSNNVKERSNYILSFGKMVFPHQLIRLMLIEQIYRAFEIKKNSKYHHQ